MTIGSLCSGYGGLDAGVQQVLNSRVAWHCEFAAAPSKILAHHWPDVPNHRDLTTTDWAAVEPVDIITAGWPCQPWSLAGKGKGADDERAIWPAIADAVRALRPRYVFLENVAAVVVLGELARAVGDLARLGYDAQWQCLRASEVGAPHGRNRCFIVASDAGGSGRHGGTGLVRAGRDSAIRSEAFSDDRNGSRASATDSTHLGHERGRVAWDGWAGPSNGGDAATHASGAGLQGPRASGRKSAQPKPLSGSTAASDVDWGVCEPAIRRWERATLRPAPRPVVNGQPERVMGYLDDGSTPEVRPGEDLRVLRDANVPQAVQRQTRGQDGLPKPSQLLADLCEHQAGSGQGRAALEGTEAQERSLRELRDHVGSACASRRQESSEQRSDEPDDAMRLMPPSAALEGGQDVSDDGPGEGSEDQTNWGQYEPAIRRWERVLGRSAPRPTEAGARGGQRLSPRFVEFMMGLPAGHVTDVPDLSRNDQLKALGNGVVPAQAAAAYAALLGATPLVVAA